MTSSKCRMRTVVAIVFCFLLHGPATSSGVFPQRDALADDADDAEAYAKYMAATEASAPLVRIANGGSQWSGSSGSSVYYRKVPANIRASSSQLILHHISASIGSPDSAPVKSIVSLSESPNRADWSAVSAYPFPRPLVHVWSAWSPWSKCSKTCGTGIMSRHRTCRREYARISTGSGIRFSYQQCLGDPTEYSLCSTQQCPGSTQDFRQFQCSLYNNRTVKGQTVHQWIPHHAGSNPCELTCAAFGKGFHYTFGKVLDGTRCTLDVENPDADFCVNGRCLAVGCDGKIGSTQKLDFCNICGGNNNTCSRVAGMAFSSLTQSRSYTSSLSYGYNSVVRVPRGANRVRITDNSSNYLAVMDERQRYIVNGNWIIDWPGRYETASGVVLHYDRSRDWESVSIKGPLLEDIIIMILVRDKNPGVYYEYWLPQNLPLPSSVKLSDTLEGPSGYSAVSPRPTTTTTAATTTATAATPRTTAILTSPVKFPDTLRGPSSLNAVTPRPTTSTTIATTVADYEPQPTAASLVRSPSRMSLHRMAIIRAGSLHYPYLTTTTTATTTTPVSTTNSTLKNQRKRKKKTELVTAKTKTKSAEKKNKRKKLKENQCGADPVCWKTKNGKQHFCLSEFVLRCKVLNYEIINGETRYEVQVLQSYKNTIPILNKEFIWAEPVDCKCPLLYVGREYIIMGKTDRGFRRNEARLLLDRGSYVRSHNRINAERVLRIRRNEAKYCQKYKTRLNLTT